MDWSDNVQNKAAKMKLTADFYCTAKCYCGFCTICSKDYFKTTVMHMLWYRNTLCTWSMKVFSWFSFYQHDWLFHWVWHQYVKALPTYLYFHFIVDLNLLLLTVLYCTFFEYQCNIYCNTFLLHGDFRKLEGVWK